MFDLKCVGFDVYVISEGIPLVPKQVGEFRLEQISERGLPVSPEKTLPSQVLTPWFRCRYRAESATDEGLVKLLKELEKTVVWEKVQKLWQQQGKDLFS